MYVCMVIEKTHKIWVYFLITLYINEHYTVKILDIKKPK